MALVLLVTGLLSRSRDFGRTMTCVNNMKQISQAIEQYQADWKGTPSFLLTDPQGTGAASPLCPTYLTNRKIFRCPNEKDKAVTDSYGMFYVSRYFAEPDANKIFLTCNKHLGRTKTVSAYLSYAVDVGATQKVTYNGANVNPEDFGTKTFGAGTLKCADGTEVTIEEGKIGVLASFLDNTQKSYNVIYVPVKQEAKFSVTHSGDSKFEIVTPAVIAGVAGTKFQVIVKTPSIYNGMTEGTEVLMTEGVVKVSDRKGQSSQMSVAAGWKMEALSDPWTSEEWLRYFIDWLFGRTPKVTPKKIHYRLVRISS